ncbi:MAG: uncharacterized protein QOI04_16 [Verrucomicrobiota bacterium]
MTKAPRAGKVKTRLTPPLTPQEAADLNVCFLRDIASAIMAATRNSAARGIGIYTPPGKEKSFDEILPDEFRLVVQRGEGFGDRLIFAAEDLLTVGFQSVCLINSDSPTVPSETFAEAATELAKPGEGIVLGPSDDGGYFLIGLKKLDRHLFADIDWSTEKVFAQTKQRAAEIGVPVHELPRGFDVDDRATLHRLCDELLGPETRSTIDLAPHTRKFLREIVAREGRARIWPA